MNVKELREALEQLGTGHDDKEVKVWLPGSTIRLNGPVLHAVPSQYKDRVLIEGNLDPGSALYVD